MITLVGFAVSNYYNKVKLALLEKGVPFQEELNWATKDEATLAQSPLGKVPFIVTPHGALSESQVIVDYLEQAFPQPPLVPADAFQAAKVRELVVYIELYLELVVRRLFKEAFFGGKVSDETKEEVRAELARNLPAFMRLAKFSPYVAGDAFTIADCSAIVCLPMVSMATKAIYGEDMTAGLPVRDYLKAMGERASVQRVAADRKANQAMMAARNRSR